MLGDTPSTLHSVTAWQQPALSPDFQVPYLHGWGCRCGKWGGMYETSTEAWTEAMVHLNDMTERLDSAI